MSPSHTVPDQMMVDKYKGRIDDEVAYFFAGIDRIDDNLGRLRKALEEGGLAENTILIFMSDNGGTAGVKLYNAGMRGYKTQPYEGGHRVPFFIHWPNGNLNHGTDVSDITAHFDVLPTLIDLCELPNAQRIDFDGRSFKEQLHQSDLKLADRILFVENQRTFIPQQWHETAGMMDQWRLVNNTELYDLSKDFSQKNNIINEFPEVAQKIRNAYRAYWKRVSPGDRDIPRVIVGSQKDLETFLSPSDWHLPEVPWNHAQIAKGSPLAGAWEVSVVEAGTYRFEVRRWPREANAPIQGIPAFTKTVDAWAANGPVEKLIYGDQMKALPVKSVQLEVGDYHGVKEISKTNTYVTFDVKLEKGNINVKGVMLDEENQQIAGAYYVYITKIK